MDSYLAAACAFYFRPCLEHAKGMQEVWQCSVWGTLVLTAQVSHCRMKSQEGKGCAMQGCRRSHRITEVYAANLDLTITGTRKWCLLIGPLASSSGHTPTDTIPYCQMSPPSIRQLQVSDPRQYQYLRHALRLPQEKQCYGHCQKNPPLSSK